jgi:hypothetical protein
MPARSVDEIHITNFTDTGLTSPLARYTFTVQVKYTDTNGVKQTYGPTSHTFPNDLTPMPLNVRRRFAVDMIQAVVRVTLGIDSWSDYA